MVRPSLLALWGLLLARPVAAQTPPPASAPATTQVEPPVGFHWQPLPEVKATLPLPFTWNYKAEISRDAQAYFLTREKIMPGTLFKTGLSLNVVRKITAKSKQSAAAYAQAFSAKSGHGAGQQVLGQETKSQGPLRLYGVCYRVANGAAGPKIIQQWAIANTATDTFYLLLFESPEKVRAQADTPKGGATYYLTQEPIGETGEYQTGLSLQVVRKAKAQTKRPAPEYAELLMMRTGFGRGQQQLEKASSVEGPWHKWTVRYRDAPPDADARIVYQLALANAKTDTLYLLTFESPEKDWPDAWKLGEVMVRELVLDARQ